MKKKILEIILLIQGLYYALTGFTLFLWDLWEEAGIAVLVLIGLKYRG